MDVVGKAPFCLDVVAAKDQSSPNSTTSTGSSSSEFTAPWTWGGEPHSLGDNQGFAKVVWVRLYRWSRIGVQECESEWAHNGESNTPRSFRH